MKKEIKIKIDKLSKQEDKHQDIIKNLRNKRWKLEGEDFFNEKYKKYVNKVFEADYCPICDGVNSEHYYFIKDLDIKDDIYNFRLIAEEILFNKKSKELLFADNKTIHESYLKDYSKELKEVSYDVYWELKDKIINLLIEEHTGF